MSIDESFGLVRAKADTPASSLLVRKSKAIIAFYAKNIVEIKLLSSVETKDTCETCISIRRRTERRVEKNIAKAIEHYDAALQKKMVQHQEEKEKRSACNSLISP
ncbi:unnamed protein product [Amoebophrya sp. A25]|nr:unnamed protein product [Amoebophrya sp. A25]|eukprot:GSA25T00015402001.1